ncbi:MAG: 2-succinyl-5-enolpyruvyl-6-hydroxy-3-cyclohexene-1-carboxylic-acid synthase [Acidimicrobiia bacterium]
MSPRDATTAQAGALVDEWARAGVREAAVAPGSRSAPLALALAADDRIRLSVFLDERSASFFAVGAAKASGRPAVVLCTSGTASANFHPAVLEAWHSRTPLIVCTADRPPELRDTGAGQAVDQLKLYGGAVRWFAEVGVPEDVAGAGRYWRSVAARACTAALGPPAGPVHLNLPYREPLIPTGDPLVDAPGRPAGAPWTSSSSRSRPPHPDDVREVTALVDGSRRGLLVAGWGPGVTAATVRRFARAAGWPVLADAVSGLRSGPTAVSTYDPLLRGEEFAAGMVPDAVVHVGAPLTNKAATRWLDGVPRLIVDPDGAWLDPNRSASRRVAADPDLLLQAVADDICWRGPGAPWLSRWLEADIVARRTVDGLLDSWSEPFEGRVARDVAAALPEGAALVVGSSMPVRDAESFVAPREGLRWVCNRGVNGIDGFVSTLLGVARAAAGAGPAVGLLGDLTLLHDAGGLLWAKDRGVDATLVVLDNEGGGIFSFLPQAGLPAHFETLFGTPHGLDLAEVAAAYGVPAQRVAAADEVVPAMEAAVDAGGVRMVIVPTDRAANVARHREVWAAVASATAGR